jgi:hypothetical protein
MDKSSWSPCKAAESIRLRSRADLGVGARGGVDVVVAVSAGVHPVRGRGRRPRLRVPLDEHAQAEELVDGARQPQRPRRVVVAVGVARSLQQPPELRVVQVRDGDHEPPRLVKASATLRRADAHRQPPLLHLPLLLLPLHDGRCCFLFLLAAAAQAAAGAATHATEPSFRTRGFFSPCFLHGVVTGQARSSF